jgi:hypothetical protein
VAKVFKNLAELHTYYDTEGKERHPGKDKKVSVIVYHGTRRKESAEELKAKGFCSFSPGEVDSFIDEVARQCKIAKNGPRLCKWIDDAATRVKEHYQGRISEFGKDQKPDLWVSAYKQASCSWAFRNPEIISDAMYWNLPKEVKEAILEEIFGTPKRVTLQLRMPADHVLYNGINLNTGKHCFKPEEIVSVEECGKAGVYEAYKSAGMEFHLPKSWGKDLPIEKVDIPKEFLNYFKKEYASGIGVHEGYTLEQHTTMVLNQFEKYFRDRNLPGGMKTESFKTLLALHDIGKPAAIEAGDKTRQHEFTLPLLEKSLKALKGSGWGSIDRISEKDANAAVALINADVIGEYLQGKISPEETAEIIKKNAKAAGMNPEDFLDLELILFKVDAGSYTEDAGGIRSLDYLFKFGKRLDFADSVKKQIDLLFLDDLPSSEPIRTNDL